MSIRGSVDEIVVVDTGSVDRSPHIARSHGARLLPYRWHDDFSAARNFGLDAASGDWILYIDADERLVDASPASLRAGLDDPRVFAARVLFRPTVHGTLTREYRLFRNDPRLRFTGAMHEAIRPDLEVLQRSAGALVVDSPATIVHLGYEGDLTAKHRRNLPLLRAAVATQPDRLYYWNHLAETLGALGELTEGAAIADRTFEQSAGRTDETSRVMRAALAMTSARLRLLLGLDALAASESGLALDPQNPTLRFVRGKALVAAGRYDEAIAVARDLIAIDPMTYSEDILSHDQRLFGSQAHDLAGVALLRMGRKAEAADAFAAAARAEPGEPSYRVKALALGARLP